MRLIFVATGEIALPAFRQLLERGPRPLALVTQPDKPVGRHQVLTPPMIKTVAIEAGVPVMQPEKIGDAVAELAALEPEVIVVMAYGQILRRNVLELPSRAIINLHASLLPKYRGAACIQAAIDAGDAETGITAMHVVRKLDAGDVICAESIPIFPTETGGELHDRLALLAPSVMESALRGLAEGTTTRVPQDEALASYVPKLEREDGEIDWSRGLVAVERRIRAYDPWPGSFFHIEEGGKLRRMKVFPPVFIVDEPLPAGEVSVRDGMLLVGCGDGALRLESVQPEGARRMTGGDYVRGRK